MDLKEGEYALSKDTIVALWKDYMSFYGNFQLQEILGGDFVVVNEDLHEEFEKFKHKLYSYVNRGFTVVEAVEPLQIWCRASKLCLKEVQLLGKNYFLISSAHLDTFCEWVYRNRSMCTSQENVVALLGGGNGQHTYFFSQALRREANHVDASYKSFEKETDHVDLICYNPVCIEWQTSKCNSLGLNFCQANNLHHGKMQPQMIEVSQKPLRTARISPDGNCFFRCIAMIVTGSQDYHEEMRLLVTTYMISNSSNEKISCLLPHHTSMQSYIVQSKM